MARVVSRPDPTHHCNPGLRWAESDGVPGGRYAILPTSSAFPAGTVWACDCGRTWVSRGTPERAREVGHVQTCFWRREHWWERRRRLRREADGPSHG